jgi:uncharacterized Zn-binding protein involved in type VI secretion
MSGFIITKGAKLNCPHQTGATPIVTDLHVKAGGQPIVLQAQPYSFPTCTGGQSKCTAGSWTRGALRVKASGMPVAISTGVSLIAPAGAFAVVLTQQRVKAT